MQKKRRMDCLQSLQCTTALLMPPFQLCWHASLLICHFPCSLLLSFPLKFLLTHLQLICSIPLLLAFRILHHDAKTSRQCYRTHRCYLLFPEQCYQLRFLLLETNPSPWGGRVRLLLLSLQLSRLPGFSPKPLAAVWLVSLKVYPPVLESSISCTDVLPDLFSHHCLLFLLLLLFPALNSESLTCVSTAHAKIPAQSQHPSPHPPGLPCCCHPDVSWAQLPPHWWGQTGLWAQSWQSTVGRWTAGCWGSSGHRGCSHVRCPWGEVGIGREWWKEGRTKVRIQAWLLFLSKNTDATGRNRANISITPHPLESRSPPRIKDIIWPRDTACTLCFKANVPKGVQNKLLTDHCMLLPL